MPGPEFFQTRMGKIFYEGTMPKIADALNRIATAIEEQNQTEKSKAAWLFKKTPKHKPDKKPDPREDHFTEADNQTWMKE